MTITIPPSVGRKVWYRPREPERMFAHDQPFDATITHVWSDECVNLLVHNECGQPLAGKTRVVFAQGRDALPGECEWTPYQAMLQPRAAPTPQCAFSGESGFGAYIESGCESFNEQSA